MTQDDQTPAKRPGAKAADPLKRGAEGIDGPTCAALVEEIRTQGLARLEQDPPMQIALCGALGMRLLAIGDGQAMLATPYRSDLVGDPATGVIHGGVITTLLDTASGVAAGFQGGQSLPRIVTLDLRIDYMRPAEPERVIVAKARVFRRARQITFVRGVAFDDREDAPIAIATGAFMNGAAAPEAGGGAKT